MSGAISHLQFLSLSTHRTQRESHVAGVHRAIVLNIKAERGRGVLRLSVGVFAFTAEGRNTPNGEWKAQERMNRGECWSMGRRSHCPRAVYGFLCFPEPHRGASSTSPTAGVLSFSLQKRRRKKKTLPDKHHIKGKGSQVLFSPHRLIPNFLNPSSVNNERLLESGEAL